MGSDAPRHVDAGVARAFRPAAVEERVGTRQEQLPGLGRHAGAIPAVTRAEWAMARAGDPKGLAGSLAGAFTRTRKDSS